MMRKVLVEFQLDPTEYAKPNPSGPEMFADTQENARTIVREMSKGNVDICETRMVGDLVQLFRGRITPSPAGYKRAHQEIISAIITTLQGFCEKKPFQAVKGPLSISALGPEPNRPYYLVTVWRQPSEVLTTNPVLDV
jgi:hypothetical protein